MDSGRNELRKEIVHRIDLNNQPDHVYNSSFELVECIFKRWSKQIICIFNTKHRPAMNEVLASYKWIMSRNRVSLITTPPIPTCGVGHSLAIIFKTGEHKFPNGLPIVTLTGYDGYTRMLSMTTRLNVIPKLSPDFNIAASTSITPSYWKGPDPYTNTVKILDFWLHYNRMIGIQFFLIYLDVVQGDGLEFALDLATRFASNTTRFIITGRNFNASIWGDMQVAFGTHALYYLKESPVKWLAYIDIDEYLMPLGRFRSLPSILNSEPYASAITVSVDSQFWYNFKEPHWTSDILSIRDHTSWHFQEDRCKNLLDVARALYFAVHVVTNPRYDHVGAHFDEVLRLIHYKEFGDWRNFPHENIANTTVISDNSFYKFCQTIHVI